MTWERSVPAVPPRLASACLAALLLCCAPAVGQDAPLVPAGDEPVASRVTEVVVFPQHAQVTRVVRVDAVVGENRVVLGDLVPGLNPHTLRASASDGARITGTEIRTVHLEQASTSQIAALDATLQQLDDELALRDRARQRADERAAFLKSIRLRVGKDMEAAFAEGGVTVGQWGDVLTFIDEGLTAVDADVTTLALESRTLQAQRATVAAERKDFAGRQPKEKKQVTVSFAAERAGPVEVSVHYMLADVVWKPSYDVHLDRAAGAIEITGYGQVVQWTGEAWEDVALTLAMSRPDDLLAVPELEPLQASLDDEAMQKLAKEVTFLGRSEGDTAKAWAAHRFERLQDKETFRRNLEQLRRQPHERLAALGLSVELVEGALSRLVDRFAGVRYAIPERATIPMDSSPHKVVAFTARVPASLRYVATPALGDTVMLQGAVTNTTGHPVLEADASLFVDDSYVGSSQTSGAAQNEGLVFGFGPDDALVVERKLVERTVKGPEAFRQSQVLTYRYAITVENFNDRAVDVDVVDQIPISKTEDIQVTFLESSVEHTRDEETGALSWGLTVAPGATSVIEYAFSVECPVGRDVHWQ